MQLQDLVWVKSGLVLSRKAAQITKEVTSYPYTQLTLRSFTQQGILEFDELTPFHANQPLDERYLTQENDVVMRLTAPYTAILIDQKAVNLVVTSNFIILRPKDDQIVPQYLCWLLNSHGVKRSLENASTSVVMRSVGPQRIGALPFVLIPQKQQQCIGQMECLMRREQQLLTQLTKEKAIYNQLLLDNLQRTIRKGMKS